MKTLIICRWKPQKYFLTYGMVLCLLWTGYIVFAQDQLIKKEDTAKASEAEKTRIKKCINLVYASLKKIKELIKQKEFEKAEIVYKTTFNKLIEEKLVSAETKKSIVKTPYISLLVNRLITVKKDLDREWARTLALQAKKAYLNKNYDEAIILAKAAASKNPDLSSHLNNFTQMCEKCIDSDTFKKETSLIHVDPEYKIREKEIDFLIRKAAILFKNQKYTDARDSLEKLLVRDPYNSEAIQLLGEIYKKLYYYAKLRKENELLERTAEVQWKWVEPILPTDRIKPPPISAKETTEIKSGLYQKLKKIIIPHIEFEDATITSVLANLSERSKQLDPDEMGINLILHQGIDVANIPRVTIDFDAIPMGELLRYICQACGLKYRIEEHAVIIGKDNIDEMDLRTFIVRSALISSITAGAGEEEEGGNEEEDNSPSEADLMEATDIEAVTGDKGAKKTASAAQTSEALKKYFSDRGVPFPEGATIAYDRRAGKLIVNNTPENLRKLDALLRDLDIQTPLVLVEAKVVEINQNDLEELGFDWIFESTGNKNKTWVITPTEKILRSFEGGNIFNGTTRTNAASNFINNLKLLPNFGSNHDKTISFTLNAIEQSGRGEILSAPKVIATSGTEAVIRMVQEQYYPDSWTEPEVTSTETTISVTPAHPDFGEATDVGIRFTVTPTVSPNNYTISLHIAPQIISLSNWTIYDYDILIGGIESNARIKMPELSKRDLDSNVKVYDGETIVLGGMLREGHFGRHDKIPLIGDIPLLGRIFRSELKNSDKRDLLIFVTARLVSGDGVPVRSDALRGLPDFHR